MNKREVALQIITHKNEWADTLGRLKKDIEGSSNRVVSDVRSIAGYIPTERDFLDVVTEILILKFFKGIIVIPARLVLRFALGLLDKHVLDRFLGPDWYAKICDKIMRGLPHEF
jgi:hypothetical protein